jgi:hypothetical protein
MLGLAQQDQLMALEHLQRFTIHQVSRLTQVEIYW